MGGYDVYCAVCGGPLRRVIFDHDAEDEDGFDRSVANRTTTAWLERVRIIGENPHSESISRYNSGAAPEARPSG